MRKWKLAALSMIYCGIYRSKVYFSGDKFLSKWCQFLLRKKDYGTIPEEELSKEGVDRLARIEASVWPAWICSAVRTDESAATAAALWEPWPARTGWFAVPFGFDVELNAEVRAAMADALCVGPPSPELFGLSLLFWKTTEALDFKKIYVNLDHN